MLFLSLFFFFVFLHTSIYCFLCFSSYLSSFYSLLLSFFYHHLIHHLHIALNFHFVLHVYFSTHFSFPVFASLIFLPHILLTSSFLLKSLHYSYSSPPLSSFLSSFSFCFASLLSSSSSPLLFLPLFLTIILHSFQISHAPTPTTHPTFPSLPAHYIKPPPTFHTNRSPPLLVITHTCHHHTPPITTCLSTPPLTTPITTAVCTLITASQLQVLSLLLIITSTDTCHHKNSSPHLISPPMSSPRFNPSPPHHVTSPAINTILISFGH